ncbi:TetR/AcrR family transcriptional regulator [Pontibacterium sp.]|uniref:TetR/AcrR family transcriptional regulator n=1 Tax=Pontibacterium sp. TaxID=2036026 RepID=UPI0035112941
MTRGRRPEHSREKILEKGAELFARNGYAATGLKEILEACEVSKGSFYNFFENKEQFAVEIINHHKSMELVRWEEEMSSLTGTYLDKIRQMVEMEIRKYDEDLDCTGCLLANLTGEVSQASPLFSEAIRTSSLEVLDSIEEDIRICQEEGTVRTDIPPRQIAELIWNGWQGALLQLKVERSVEPLRRHTATLFTMIEAPTLKG